MWAVTGDKKAGVAAQREPGERRRKRWPWRGQGTQGLVKHRGGRHSILRVMGRRCRALSRGMTPVGWF